MICVNFFLQTESKLEEHKGNEHTNKDGNNVNSESETPANAQIDDDSATQVKETAKEDKVFECDICTYKTKSANGIKIHKAKKHTYTCRDCDKTFSDEVAYANHSLDCYKSYNYYYSSRRMNPVQFCPRCHPRFPPESPTRFPPRFPSRFPIGPLY